MEIRHLENCRKSFVIGVNLATLSIAGIKTDFEIMLSIYLSLINLTDHLLDHFRSSLDSGDVSHLSAAGRSVACYH